MVERFCEECGERLIGRSDKRFCSTACRTSFHNAESRRKYAYSGRINSLLKRNHSILMESLSSGKMLIRKEELSEKMFSFENYTSLRKMPFHRKVYRCYDISYIRTSAGDIRIKNGF